MTRLPHTTAMRYLLHFAIALRFAVAAPQLFAQKAPPLRALPPCDSISLRCPKPVPPADIALYFQHRRSAAAFYQSMQVLSEPSTVSTGFFNWGRGRGRWNPLDNTINADPDRDRIPYVLNADIQPRVPLGKRWTLGARKYKNPVLLNVHFVPWFKVRILANDEDRADSSLPVRTPSYMPGFEAFFAMANWWRPEAITRTYLSLVGYHHSNGQDGTGGEFVNGYFNTYNGDFSDDFVVQGHVGRFWRTRADTEKPAKLSGIERTRRLPGSYRITHLKAGLSIHPSMTDTVMPFYGNVRGQLVFTRITGPYTQDVQRDREHACYHSDDVLAPQERLRFEARMSMILDPPNAYQRGPYEQPRPIAWSDLSKRMNLYGTLFYHLPRVPTALFAQAGYYGSDPYNAYFQESLFFWRIGLAMGVFVDGDPEAQ